MDTLLLRTEEAARQVGLSHRHFQRLLAAGLVKSVRTGRRRLVSVKALEEYIRRLEADGDGECVQ